MREKANSELVRRQNRRLILDTIREQGPMPRIEIGRRTGLSPASVTTITAQLIAEGILQEVAGHRAPAPAAARGRRGRPLIWIGFRRDAAHVLAVKLSIDGVELALADARGAIVRRHREPAAPFDAKAGGFGQRLTAEVKSFLARGRISSRRIARIGVAVQGVADSRRGTIVWSPAFHGQNIAVTMPLQKALGIPCSIGNDANMIAEGLLGHDRPRYSGTSAIVFAGYGVGMGLIADGRVYHGPTGAAAEFGHMNHLPGGPLCRCGRRGCVEAYAADYGILRSAGDNPEWQPPRATAIPAEVMRNLEERARCGDERVRTAYALAGEALGYGLARVIALLSPQRIVLAGPAIRAFDLIGPALEKAIGEGVVAALRTDVTLETAPIDTDMIIQGTVGSALRRVDREIFSSGPIDWRNLVLEKTG